MPIVIADAGPFIALARVDRLALLPALFGEVVVTEAVKTELLAGVFAETALLKAALSARWCKQQPKIATLAERSTKLASNHLIGAGESSGIALAQYYGERATPALVLLDDARGRRAAQRLQIAMIGTAGVLLLGKQAELVSAVAPLLEALNRSGYFLSERLIKAALAQAGEQESVIRPTTRRN